MGIFSKIFSSSEVVKEGLGMLKDAGDAIVYTDEEKARDAAKATSEARQLIVSWMESTKGQNIARRLIALSISFVWLLMYVTSAIMSIVSVWTDSPDNWIRSAQVIGDYSEAMNGAMMLILAFYFAAPHMGDIASAALNKFSARKG